MQLSMPYFQPGPGYFVGDCMPFSHDGLFHLFYLLDENHHQGAGGLGGHQWAHVSSRDLVMWEEHPLAVPITDQWEKSICTGSVFFHDGIYHAFYAVRDKNRHQHLCRSESRDGLHFTKTAPRPFASAPTGYRPDDFRDPFVFTDESGLHHLLVTSRLAGFPLHDRGGCLLQYTSRNLKDWEQPSAFLIPGGAGYPSVPECPDHFFWKGWYYLIFGSDLCTHYRMARQPMGPWVRPADDQLGGRFCAVMKTASFGENRRIAAAWVGERQDNRDDGALLWGGQALFRELVQHPDGTLGTKWPREMIPATGEALTPPFSRLTPGASSAQGAVRLDAAFGEEVGSWDEVPDNFRLRCVVRAEPETRVIGLGLRGSGAYGKRADLLFDVSRGTLSLGTETVHLRGTDFSELHLDVVVTGTIIDVCINRHQTAVNRFPEPKGPRLFFFCSHGVARFEQLDLRPLLPG